MLDEYRSRAIAGGDGEEAATACFRAAETQVNRNQPAEALGMLMLGLGRSVPSMATARCCSGTDRSTRLRGMTIRSMC